MAVLAQALQRVLLAAAVIAGVAVAAPQTAGAASSAAAAVSAEAAPSVTTAPGLPGHHGPREVMHRAMRLPASLHAAVTPTGALLLAAPVFLLVYLLRLRSGRRRPATVRMRAPPAAARHRR